MAVEVPEGDPTLKLPYAYGGPLLHGRLRVEPEDFCVDEILGYSASGRGEHVLLTVRKRQRNTHDVARLIAKHAGVAQVAIGYAGLKDRNALTLQHFSVQLPGREAPDWAELDDEGIKVLAAERHDRKVRRGRLRGNRFDILVRDWSGDQSSADQLLHRISGAGVPNYFGAQRFGRNGNNLVRVDALFRQAGRRPGREQRGLLLSAARAHLFNQVLADRVTATSWCRAVDGDVMLLAGSERQFAFDAADETIPPRVAELDIHPSGPLCGRRSRALQPSGRVAEAERQVLDHWQPWIAGLERFGLDADRRSLRLAVEELQWDWSAAGLRLNFRLTAGAYATAVLRELVVEQTGDA